MLNGGGAKSKIAVAMSRVPLIIFKASPLSNFGMAPIIRLASPLVLSIKSAVDINLKFRTTWLNPLSIMFLSVTVFSSVLEAAVNFFFAFS